jgi:TIR domain
MRHDVFISHSSKDKQIADAVCHHLEQNGIRCWIAPRDILPGGDWAESIVKAVGESRLMLLIFSSNANDSSQINREVNLAADENIPIVPFRIENVQPTNKLRYYLSTPHWLDALTPPLEKHLGQLVQSIKAMLSGESNKNAAFYEAKGSPKPKATSNSKVFSTEQKSSKELSFIKTVRLGAIIGAVVGAIIGPILELTVWDGRQPQWAAIACGIYGLIIGAIGLPLLKFIVREIK